MKKILEAKFSKIMVHKDFSVEEKENTKRVFQALAGECINNSIYLFGTNSNTICKIDCDTGSMEIQPGDPLCSCGKEYLFTKSVAYKSYIYFISNRKKYIIKFDLLTNEKKYIYIEGNPREYEVCLYNKILFLLPMGYADQIILVTLENDSVDYISTNYNLQLDSTVLSENYIFVNGVVAGDCIYRGCYINPSIQKFLIDKGKFQYISIEEMGRPIKELDFDGECFWLLSKVDGLLVRWDPQTNKVNFSIDLSKETGKGGMIYVACKYVEGSIYVLEKSGCCIIKLSIRENEIYVYDCRQIPGFELRIPDGQAFSEAIRADNEGRIYFFPFRANGVVVLDREKGVRFYKTETSKLLQISGVEQEQTEHICTLDSFFESIRNNERSIDDTKESIIGYKILKTLQ